MKTKFIILSLLFAFLSSCSNNDDNVVTETSDPADLIPTTYYPLTTANYWKYKVSVQGTDSNDILTIGNNVVINSNTYQNMIGTADPSGQANGFYCGILNNNNLRRDGSSIKLTGIINYSFPGNIPIAINISDFIIFKQNGVPGTELSAVTGTYSQTVNVSATQQLPLTIEYKLRSVAGDNLATFTSNSNSYTNIKQSKLILSLKITTTQTIPGLPTPIQVTLLDTQDVSTSVLHYANNIGMIYDNTLFSYNLSAAAIQIIPPTSPIPASMNVTQEEFLESFHIN